MTDRTDPATALLLELAAETLLWCSTPTAARIYDLTQQLTAAASSAPDPMLEALAELSTAATEFRWQHNGWIVSGQRKPRASYHAAWSRLELAWAAVAAAKEGKP